MERSTPFNPENSETPISERSRTIAAASSFLQDGYSKAQVSILQNELEKSYLIGGLRQVKEIDHRISQAEHNRLLGETMELIPMREKASLQFRDHANDYFIGKIQPLTTKSLKDVVAEYQAQIIDLATCEEDIDPIFNAQWIFYEKLGGTSLDRGRVEQFLHEGSIEKFGDQKEFDGKEVRRAIFREMMDAVLVSEHPDLRDTEFFYEIIRDTSNKFLQKVAVKKAVEIVSEYPSMIAKKQIDGSEIYPSISQLYDDLTSRGLKMERRDFLFTLPFVIKEGIVQEDLLKTAMKTQKFLKLRGGTQSEHRYFSSLVDLYETDQPAMLHPLFEMLQGEIVYANSRYFNERLPKLQTTRKNRGINLRHRRLQFQDLKEANIRMKQRIVEEVFPEDYALIESLPEKEKIMQLNSYFAKCLIGRAYPDEYDQIRGLSDEDQQDFVKLYLNNLRRDIREKKAGLYSEVATVESDTKDDQTDVFMDDLWVHELDGVIGGIEGEEVTRIENFDKLLKKLSALKLVAPSTTMHELFERVRGGTLDDANREADKLQLSLFPDFFNLTPDEIRTLREKSNLWSVVDLRDKEEDLRKLYKSYGNFNAFYFLLDRYNYSGLQINPAAFRDTMVPLLKEVVQHTVQKDFTYWRNTINKTINGESFDPWPVPPPSEDGSSSEERTKRLRFRSAWKTDDVSESKYTVHELPSLYDQIDIKYKSLLPVLDNPDYFFSQKQFWKDEGWIESITGGAETLQLAAENAALFVEWMKDDQKSTIELTGIDLSPKNQSAITESVKLANIVIALNELKDKIKSLQERRTQSINQDEFKEFYMLIKKINPSKYFKSVDQINQFPDAEVMVKFGKALETIFRKGAMDDATITLKDSSEPYDLLTAGQPTETIVNCMSYEGDPKKNAYILDITTSRNKKIITAQRDGRTVSRAILKFLTDTRDSDRPIVILEDLISEDKGVDYKEQMVEHLTQKFQGNDIILGEPVFVPYADSEIMKEIIQNGGELEESHVTITKPQTRKYLKQKQNKIVTDLILGEHTESRVGSELVEIGPIKQPREMTNTTLLNTPQFIQTFSR